MSLGRRNPQQTADVAYDLIIIGGGIYGTMLLYEASRVGVRALLVEKSDFGGNTSFNNLRIVHGGLRYLQTLHLARIFESVAERRWFLRTFPDLVKPLPCLMPLYGGLTKNRPVLATALLANDILSWRRNVDVGPDRHLPRGRTLDRAATKSTFPGAREDKLQGGALWYDASVRDCHRALVETIRWSVTMGGTALNYVEATGLLCRNEQVEGITARDTAGDVELEFRAPVVVNAAGPECRALSSRLDREHPPLFYPSMAWNLLLDRPPLSDCAVAIEPPRSGARVYFAHSLRNRLFVGTGHSGVAEGTAPAIRPADFDAMLDDLNLAVPGLDVSRDDIVQVFSGQLPARKPGTDVLADVPTIVDHQKQGGPKGLLSVSGVKFTTARSTAARLLSFLASRRMVAPGPENLAPRPAAPDYRMHPDDCPDAERRLAVAKQLVAEESVVHLSDLLFRRADFAGDPKAAIDVGQSLVDAIDWPGGDRELEMSLLKAEATPKLP